MLIRKGFKFRLKTDRFIEAALSKAAGCNRFVWNTTLAIQKERLDNKLPCLSYYEMASILIDMKSEFEFLSDRQAQTLQQTLKDLARAIQDGLDKGSQKQLPKVRKKGLKEHFRYPQSFKINGNVPYLPKIGWVPFYKSWDIEGIPKNVSLSLQGKH